MEILEILKKYSFVFKKSLGQNFLTDPQLLDAIARDAGVEETDTVVEIGAGAGTLTRALSARAARVVAFDIDESLIPVLRESLSGCDNTEVVFRDVLKCTDEELNEIIGGRFKVVANIPYYITTPLVMRFAESTLPVDSVTVTIQEEVAERLVAEAGTPEYGAISATVALRGDARITRNIPRRMFRPVPNVDSAVVRIDFVRDKFGDTDVNKVTDLVRAAFRMRRKTLFNNLVSAGYAKDKARAAIERAGFATDIRGERLSAEDYVKLYGELNSVD